MGGAICFIQSTNSDVNLRVPAVAQLVKNPTSIHEDVGLVPGPSQWVPGIWRCRELWCRSQTWLGSGVAVAVV